ncbi:MAG: dihydroorotase [Chloroflexota bacterium]
MNLLIKNGHIIDPAQGIDKPGDILISKGKVSKLSFDEPTPEADTYIFDARGLVVSPGFVDLHCHLRDPGFADKETIATGSRAAAKGGFTTICCMPNTSPPLDTKETIDYVKDTALKQGAARILPIGCVSKGRAGRELADLKALAEAGAIGFSDDGSPVMDSAVMRQALEFSRVSKLPIMDHCEDLNLAKGGQMNEGMLSARLDLSGIPGAAEEIMVARDLILAELTQGWVHICHVSTANSVELIRRAKAKGIKVTAEATPHHLALTEALVTGYNPHAKVNPPLRSEEDVKTLASGLKEGIIDVIATDHAPHTESEKMAGFVQAPSGISVFETALGTLMCLVESGIFTLSELIARLTTAPAKLLGNKYGGLGTLSPGSEADITIFDPAKEWEVDTTQFLSKGKNTPLNGAVLRGKVMVTLCGGKVVYRDSSVKLEGI